MKKRWLFGAAISSLLLLILLGTLLISHAMGVQAAPALSWPSYQRGSSGENVRSIQYMLSQRGAKLATDGLFGPVTTAAVKSFQSRNHLAADGIVGNQTWPRLIVPTRTGSTGAAVSALQRQLNAHGARLAIDGRFGAATAAAVKSFQAQAHLPASGAADVTTWNKLVSSSGNSGGAYVVVHSPTISAAFINKVLAYNHSPAQGKGQALYNYGVKYGIDPVYALAFFRHESTFGKYGVAKTTKALGNIRCSKGYQCYKGFRKYPTWEAGFDDWYKLIRSKYVNQWHLTTVDQILPKYAPASENDVAAYIRSVKQAVNAWRAGRIKP